MEDDLAAEYDVVVLGTGMPECILAAAVARIGKTVLHLDRNEFYGGEWASFNFDGFQKWIASNTVDKNTFEAPKETEFADFLDEGETAVPLSHNYNVIKNVNERVFVKENLPKINEELVVDNTCVEKREDNSLEENKENVLTEEATVSSSNDGPNDSGDTNILAEKSQKKEWCMDDIKSSWRKFNLDLAPKILFSQGSLVNLLISSNIARYAEFKCVTRVLTYLNGKLEQVPCSRADVFSTRDVTIVEKRMLMKLLTFCLDFEQQPEEYRDYENKTFSEFLKSRKLTPNVQHYVLHAIAMVSKESSTIEGLQSVQRFLKSLGRYGNTPFLWPLYGSGELPQCFCRLCAVFGGIYYLKRSIDAMIVNSDGKLTAIVSRGKKIKCRWLITESSYVPETFLNQKQETSISRGIFITDKSILQSEKEQITLLRLPAGGALKSSVNVLELCPSSMACPSGLHVVHLTCKQVSSAEEDLKFALEILFDSGNYGDSKSEFKKPKIVWCVYFNRSEVEPESIQTNCPSGVVTVGGPGGNLDFDHSVSEAKTLFTHMFPDEEFLPRAPDPEEILLDEPEVNNPGPAFSADGDIEADNEAGNVAENVHASDDNTAKENEAENVPENVYASDDNTTQKNEAT